MSGQVEECTHFHDIKITDLIMTPPRKLRQLASPPKINQTRPVYSTRIGFEVEQEQGMNHILLANKMLHFIGSRLLAVVLLQSPLYTEKLTWAYHVLKVYEEKGEYEHQMLQATLRAIVKGSIRNGGGAGLMPKDSTD
ncbi:unnamed protein product [Peronospora belbahrii]|uniref:Uncharacterized protein n=1 Tax=Peronospora belbahrii TaxID=622444 RepID=A0AAU9KLQ8_9STRA|nr:unnamed protein product [Peronospora belbahrii]CAH0513392.1 unnamed protein product [Peronospora belbahrii]